MIVVQFICTFLYIWQMPKFIYSEAIVGRPKQSLNVDPIKCSRNDLLCLENKNTDDSSLVDYSDFYNDNVAPSSYDDEENTDYDGIIDADNRADDYSNDFLVKSSANKVKRSLELVEEQPPEGTYRPPSNKNEDPTVNAMPSTPKDSNNIPTRVPQTPTEMPSVAPIPQPPTIPSTKPQQASPRAENDVTTKSPDVEVLETTTEDYADDGEPNCDYNPFTWILKCGLNLITSMLGFSDTCCKPLF